MKAAYDIAAHSEGSGYFLLFWVSCLVVVVTTAVTGVRPQVSNRTRWILVAAYGTFTFIPKYLMSAAGPDYFDEFGHFRQAQDMLAQHSVFVYDPYLPISKYYPGLEVVTDAIHNLIRLSVWDSGQLVLLAAHILSLVVVWRLAAALGAPDRWAFIAGIVFSLNPSFMYFDTQYAYESLGLPMAMAALLFALNARRSAGGGPALLWSAAAMVTASSVVITHHVSAGFAVLGLVVIAITVPTEWSRHDNPMAFFGPWVAALISGVCLTLWVTTYARSTIGYIEPHVQQTITQMANLILGRKSHSAPTSIPPGPGPLGAPVHPSGVSAPAPAPTPTVAGGGGSRHLFSGSGLPFYEVIFALLSPVIATAFVAAAFVQVWLYRGARRAILRRLPFLIIGLAYVGTLPIDLTSAGSETAHRLWAYAYLGVAICMISSVGIWVRLAERIHLPKRGLPSAAIVALIVLCIGNVASGENIYYRFPGPYVFGTDTRSRTAEVFQVAAWADAHIPAGANVVTDRFTAEIIEAYTRLQIPAPGSSEIFKLYYEGNNITYGVHQFLYQHQFDYWILDLHIAYYNPIHKLFVSYIGPENVNGGALLQAGGTPQLRVMYRNNDYEVLAIHLGPNPASNTP